MKHILSLPLAMILLIFVVPRLTLGFIDTLRDVHGWPQNPEGLASGLGLGLALAWWKRPNWWLHTVLHEACHALVCLLVFVPVRSFQVSNGQGGAVLHDKTDWPRTVLIAIAPYVVPLLLGPVLIAQHFLPPAMHTWATFAIGLLFIQHLTGLFHNIRLNYHGSQSDLPRVGLTLSAVLIWCGLLGLLWIMAHVLWR